MFENFTQARPLQDILIKNTYVISEKYTAIQTLVRGQKVLKKNLFFLKLILMLNFGAHSLKTLLSLPGLFGGLFSTFLMLLCLVELCLKEELELELLFAHIWVASSFWHSLSARFLSLSFS